jgi:hypothetical protein
MAVRSFNSSELLLEPQGDNGTASDPGSEEVNTMAASSAGTLGTPRGRGTPGGHIAVGRIRRPRLSRGGDAPAVQSTQQKGRTMNTNAGTTHRLHRLPGPVAAAAAWAANTWAVVPSSRASPPGRSLAGAGLRAAQPGAGADAHAAAAAGEGRPS